jgi:hypothetical protein
MPKYTINFAGNKVTSFETTEPVSRTISRKLQGNGTPNTRIDSGGNANKSSFRGQDIDRGDLREVKQIRESGGVVSHLVHAKALMQFGTGIEFQSDDDEVAEWLNNNLNDIDNLLIELGEDALWYPYSLAEVVENRAGNFSHIEPIQPWTMLPMENEHGEIVRWEQEIQGDFGANTQRFEPDEIASFILNKNSGRDNTGVSEVLRARQEIEGYRQNANAINNAIEYAAWPRRMFKVGDPDGGIIDDNELRRVRNRVDNLDEDTTLVAGPHIEHEMLEAQNFEFDKVTEHDLRKLSLALGLPLELANVGSDGLGSGMPADLRLTLFERQARAQQRALADQFVQQVIRPLLAEYSPYPEDANVELRFGDPIEEEERTLTDKAPYMRLDEIREELDLPPEEDEELADSYRKPANIQAPEEEEPEGDGGIDGLFSDKEMQDVEDIDTGDYPEAAVENARMALDAKEETGNPNDCGTQVGWERANQLDNGEDLSEDTISRMAQFERHEDNYDPDAPEEDCGWMMWKAWGGKEGIEWAQDKMDEFEEARREGEEGNEQRAVAEWEQHYLDLHKRTWEADADVNLMQFDDYEVPEFVKERLKDVIRGGAIFNDFETIGSEDLLQLRNFLIEELEDGRWNIDGIANRIQDLSADLTQDQAETIARTEVASAANTARAEGYEERGQEEGEVFKWVGVFDDGRTTDACKWLLEQTNPKHGGTPVPLDELRELIDEAPEHDPEMQDDLARPGNYTVHPNERKTFVRHIE